MSGQRKDCRCSLCKYLGDHQEKELHRAAIYRGRGEALKINLCYTHSWELHRLGQRAFLQRYRHNFMQFLGTETEQELIDYVRGAREHGVSRWAA